MICSSEKRFFTSNLLGVGNWTPNRCATQTRGDVGGGRYGRRALRSVGRRLLSGTGHSRSISMQAPGGIALRQMLGAGRLLDEKMNAGARDERNRLAFARLMLLYNNNSPPRSPASRVPPSLFSCVLSGIAPQPVLPLAVVGR
ncbi:hypothetical protein EYC57_09355 [Xanthomonas oryzae]|nr:hypothetical protein EYC57_09355 [Xanthomonas oryzae]